MTLLKYLTFDFFGFDHEVQQPREVSDIANLFDISEYRVFEQSGVISNLKQDFDRYLKDGYIPPQLKQLCRVELDRQKNTG